MPQGRPLINIIAAMAENRVIGNRGRLPWRLPDEMKHFVRLTTGHTVIMGRKTFESIGSQPLPNRRNIILASNPDYANPSIETAPSIPDAIALATPPTTTETVSDTVSDPVSDPPAELRGADPVSPAPPSAIRHPPSAIPHPTSPIPPEVFICGGEQAYRDALALADNLYLTLVHASPDGDAHFPDYDPADWNLIDQVRHEPDARHEYAFTFQHFERLR